MATQGTSEPALKTAGFRKSVKFALGRMLGGSLEDLMFRWRRGAMRVNTWRGLPYTALYGMDRKLERHFSFDGGTFVEAGANDGIAQSNTYFLENKYGWKGLLIEPVPKYFRMCQRSRDASVVNCALGAFENDGAELEMLAGGLMSLPVSVDEEQLLGRSVLEHAELGAREFGGVRAEVVRARVRALSNVLDESGISDVDFFSLDVEGFEIEVFKGLDMSRHAPRWMLIETQQIGRVTEFLGRRYAMVELLSHHDYLFKRTDA